MTPLIILLILAAVILTIAKALFGGCPGRRSYLYAKKEYLMTAAEHACFDALLQAVGGAYHVFPQVHLDDLVYPKSSQKDRLYAFRHINQKSVDFVLCDKEKLSPLLAIELDDWSHARPVRQERDREVERILADAGMPLLRLKDHVAFENIERLKKEIGEKINPGKVVVGVGEVK